MFGCTVEVLDAGSEVHSEPLLNFWLGHGVQEVHLLCIRSQVSDDELLSHDLMRYVLGVI